MPLTKVVTFVAVALSFASGCTDSSNRGNTDTGPAPVSVNAIRGRSATDNRTVYKDAIERYFNAYMKADIDGLLASLHPEGPMYPEPAAIQQLRNTASGNALPGEAVVKQIEILEEGEAEARVRVSLLMRVDIGNSGNFREETSHLTCELRKHYEEWRLFNTTTR